VYDLQKQPPKQIRQRYNVLLEHTVRELNNQACIALEAQQSGPDDNLSLTNVRKREIYCSRSFRYKIRTYDELRQSVASYSARAAEKLRAQASLTACIYVNIQSSRFDAGFYNRSQTIPLITPTNDTRTIVQAALYGLEAIFVNGYKYARAGVGLLQLSDDLQQQPDLFASQQSLRSIKTMQALDNINQKFGKSSIQFAAQGLKTSWSMARNYQSPHYTTRLTDIPVIKL
jgi:DNA polymerase V